VVINARSAEDAALLEGDKRKEKGVDFSGPAVGGGDAVANPAAGAAAALPMKDMTPPVISDAEKAAFGARGFFGEMVESVRGHGADEVGRMPAAARELWKQAGEADKKSGASSETLDLLRELELTMRGLPGGTARLEVICQKARGEAYGLWMAREHWETLATRYGTGQFDLSDVREIERPYLIGLLKEKTDKALEPVKAYFPPVDPTTGQKDPFRPSQLAGITAANAVDVKDKATFAEAVLLAQIKLEPEMSGVDKGFVSGQLADVNHVLARARELEPAAKMAAVRAEQEKKATAEKARRDAAAARAQAATRPH